MVTAARAEPVGLALAAHGMPLAELDTSVTGSQAAAGRLDAWNDGPLVRFRKATDTRQDQRASPGHSRQPGSPRPPGAVPGGPHSGLPGRVSGFRSWSGWFQLSRK